MMRTLIRLTIAFCISVILSNVLVFFIYQELFLSETLQRRIVTTLSLMSVLLIGGFLMVRWAFGYVQWWGPTVITSPRHKFVFVWSAVMMAASFFGAKECNFHQLQLGTLLLWMFGSGVMATAIWYSVTCTVLLRPGGSDGGNEVR